jgi:hypothetical protein
MDDHVYRVIQLVGSSEKSVSDAIERGVAWASKTLRNVRWFEVVETRGSVENGKVSQYQGGRLSADRNHASDLVKRNPRSPWPSQRR